MPVARQSRKGDRPQAGESTREQRASLITFLPYGIITVNAAAEHPDLLPAATETVKSKWKRRCFMPTKKNRSLRGKISLTMIVVVGLILIIVGVFSALSAGGITKTLSQSNEEMTQTSSSRSSESMIKMTQSRLQELAYGKAELADRLFYEFETAVCNAAEAAEILYANADSYSPRDVPPPSMENDGKLALQALYATGVDPDDEEIKKEVRLLGNLQDTLYVINSNAPSIVSNYIATESGIMVQADYISAMKFDEAGRIMPLDAKDRPWYQGAADSGELYLTPVVEDLHTRRPTVMCGVPIYCGGVFKGVAGAGMYLDNVEAIIQDMELGETGEACIVNQFGQVLFSSDQDDETSPFSPGKYLLSPNDETLKTLATKAVNRESGVMLLELNNASRYVAYAPMTTTGWSVFVILSQEEVDAPTEQLQADLDRISKAAAAEADRRAKASMLLLPLVLALALIAALIASLVLSKRIVNPMVKLTEKVRRVEGDNLDFRWDLETGDETQTLANSFESLTERMKSYIDDIQSITAEKERIGAEMALATRIQTDMLPNIFPAFPDRRDFDIYASMDPAKEVGGDFYDFFLVDDDHLALVIADVSDKGVPAALFMMVSKILLKNQLMNKLSPAKTLERVNDQICSNNRSDMFVTAWIGVLDLKTGKLTAANAGHEYPTLKKADGRFELIKDRHGFVMGGMTGMKYAEYELQLDPGAKIFVYTDGLPEAGAGHGEQFGMERMLQVLRKAEDGTPQQILNAVDRAVASFVKGAPQFDDLTMLCVEYCGPQGEGGSAEDVSENSETTE